MRGKKKTQLVHVPEELWTEVLARLPVKTLLRFRYVCKSWLSIIDNPTFVPMHLHLSKKNRDKSEILVCQRNCRYLNGGYNHDYSIGTRTADNKFKKSRPDIIKFPRNGDCLFKGYVNGLMLILWLPKRAVKQRTILWNPSIRKALLLPSCPITFSYSNKAFLGFDTTIDDYKVVVFNTSHSQAAIYELKKGVWRSKDVDCAPSYHPSGNVVLILGVFLNGIAYWMTVIRSGDNHSNLGLTRLISFDFGSEMISYENMPDLDAAKTHGFLFILRDSLALFGATVLGECCIWIMEKHDGSHHWMKWYSRNDMGIAIRDLCHFLYIEKKGLLVARTRRDVSSYDIGNHQWKRLLQLFKTKAGSIQFMDVYVESLVLSTGFGSQTLMSLCSEE